MARAVSAAASAKASGPFFVGRAIKRWTTFGNIAYTEPSTTRGLFPLARAVLVWRPPYRQSLQNRLGASWPHTPYSPGWPHSLKGER
jgi:hypothetical protein